MCVRVHVCVCVHVYTWMCECADVYLCVFPAWPCSVLKQVALAYAFVFTGRVLGKRFAELRAAMDGDETGGLVHLAEMHATSAGLKALCTFMTADGLEGAWVGLFAFARLLHIPKGRRIAFVEGLSCVSDNVTVLLCALTNVSNEVHSLLVALCVCVCACATATDCRKCCGGHGVLLGACRCMAP